MNKKNSKFTKFKKGKSKSQKYSNSKVQHGKPNDISWYNKNPLLLKQSGIVNFLHPVGSEVDVTQNGILNNFTFNNKNFKGTYKRFPGVARLNWIPTPGVSKDAIAPINKCMAKYFMNLRLENMSISAYDPADVAFYILAWDSIFAYYGYLTLVYAHSKKWSFTNNYLPKAILTALNVNYNDIINNLADFIEYVDVFQEAIQKSMLPKDLTYVARHLHMSAQVYKDSENEKAQMYVFVPDFVYQYDATVPQLSPIAIGSNPTPLTFADLKLIGDSLLNSIIADEDMQIIAADIKKYLGDNVYKPEPLNWETQADPVYNKEMLWQIHNSNFLPYSSATGINITQTITATLDTIVYWNPTFTVSDGLVGVKKVIDSNSESPTPEEVIESTRLMYVIDSEVQTAEFSFDVTLKSCGSEILTGVKIVVFDDQNQLITLPATNFINSILGISSIYGEFIAFPLSTDINSNLIVGPDLMSWFLLSQFEYHPILYVGTSSGSTTMPCFVGFGAQLDNYAIIEDSQLMAINEQTLLSEFNL